MRWEETKKSSIAPVGPVFRLGDVLEGERKRGREEEKEEERKRGEEER